jgi:hypothetical protein
VDMIALFAICASACEKDFKHQIYGLCILTLTSQQVCIGNIDCMYGCMYVCMHVCMFDVKLLM